jgi:antirestriction protein ArdC
LNHEAVHATGAAHRVDRDIGKRFSAHSLAAEELVELSPKVGDGMKG